MYSCNRQQYAACTERNCVENITCFPFSPSNKRKVTQSSKPDDHIEETFDLALICLYADHFPLNSMLDSIVGVVEPSWLRTYKH